MSKRIYVGNLPFSATEDEVRDIFSAHGTVESVHMVFDRETGRPRGFCFVEMDQYGAEAAISQANGQVLDGRPMRVSEAKERSGGGTGGGGGRPPRRERW